MYETLKCIENHLYWEIKRLYQKYVFSVFFIMLGTKSSHSIWESKTKLLKTCHSSGLRKIIVKTDVNQPIRRNTITLPKRYILIFFELVTYKKKKRKNACKTVYIRKEKDNTRNVYNESFIVP